MTPASIIFDRLHEKFESTVTRAVASFLKDPSDREDAVQISWIQIFQAVETHTRITNEKAWVHEVAKNAALQVARKNRSGLDTCSLDEMAEEGIELSSQEPLTEMMDPALRNALKAAVDQLAPRMREVINLRFWAGLSVKEIAAQLGISVSAATMALSRARAELASMFVRSTDRRAA